MLPITTKSDYTGYYLVPNKDKSLEPFIDKWESFYIEKLLNAVYLQLIKTQNLNDLPQKIQDVINGTIYTNTTNDNKVSVSTEGLKEALKGFVYFRFNRSDFSPTTGGNTNQISANSVRQGHTQNGLQSLDRFNASVRIWKKLREFICFYQKVEGNVTSSVDNLDGTYTLALSTQLYLEAQDIITIESVGYSVVSVSTNDVVISAPTGQTIEGDYFYTPFVLEELNLDELKPTLI